MQKVILGKTGIEVSRVAFGGLFVASFSAQLDDARAAVHRATELGINYFDTAPNYGNSEEVLGKTLVGVKQPVILSTKLGGRPTPFLPQDKACLRASVEESLRLLGRDCIDILMIHEPDRPGQYEW
jgi:aryl-alcohol dehydrogenase-like predicted oxidoreductase